MQFLWDENGLFVLLGGSRDPGSYVPKCAKEWTMSTLAITLYYISLGHILSLNKHS